MAPHLGWMQGDHPSAPGHYLDPHDRRTSSRTLQRGRKAVDAADEETDQGRGKDVERKSPKTDFPPQLANPGHFTCSQKRTFSPATDTSGLAVIGSEHRYVKLLPISA